MKKIKLTNGMETIVDDDVYKWASKNNWSAKKTPRGFDACRWTKVDGKRKFAYLHREIMKPEATFEYIDHINHNTLDNTRNNLRICTPTQNNMNRKISKNNKSGFKGVSLQGNRYLAMIQLNDQTEYLGSFKTPQEAAKKYNDKALQIYGQFAWLNKI